MTVLFVVLTIVAFLAVDWLVRRGKAPVPVPVAATPPVRLPGGVFFARSHTWLNLFPSGRAWLGIDDFVARLLDDPRVTFLARPGTRVKPGDPIFRLEEDGHAFTVRSPISGEVLAVNDELASEPGLLRRAPFVDAWAIEVAPERASDLKSLLLGDETRRWMSGEFGRLRDVLAGAGGVLQPAMLQDGGPPVAGAMKLVGPEVWERFEKEFLEVR
jgi:glycine cleavage system H protein